MVNLNNKSDATLCYLYPFNDVIIKYIADLLNQKGYKVVSCNDSKYKNNDKYLISYIEFDKSTDVSLISTNVPYGWEFEEDGFVLKCGYIDYLNSNSTFENSIRELYDTLTNLYEWVVLLPEYHIVCNKEFYDFKDFYIKITDSYHINKFCESYINNNDSAKDAILAYSELVNEIINKIDSGKCTIDKLEKYYDKLVIKYSSSLYTAK